MRHLFYIEQNYAFAILRPLQEAIWQLGHEIKWFLVGDELNRDYLNPNEEELSDAIEVLLWKPDVVFAPGNWIPTFFPGFKVALFHGFNVAKATRTDDKGHFNIRGCFDLYCTQGPNTTTEFIKRAAKHKNFAVRETGWPPLDTMFTTKTPAQSDDVKTILLCSTFTESLSCAPHIYEEIKRLRDNGKWRWLVQFHPKMPKSVENDYKRLQNANLTFVETDNVIPYLQLADLMVCDTSSVMTMFLMQRKPVVTFRNQSRGDTSHLINVTGQGALETAIEFGLQHPPQIMQSIDNFIAETHPYSDGRSSERVINAVLSQMQSKQKLKRKPLNLIRNIKSLLKLI